MLEITIIGNLGGDARVIDQDGRKFVAFNVAHTDKWVDDAGTTHESTEWVSCTLNGDGGNVLPYLKAGTKIFASGRGSVRIYSSPKERKMKAGINISVTRIELVGGTSDDVPRELIDASTGSLKRVYKAYYIAQGELANITFDSENKALLQDKKGTQFRVVKDGWVQPLPQESNAAESTTQEPAQDQVF